MTEPDVRQLLRSLLVLAFIECCFGCLPYYYQQQTILARSPLRSIERISALVSSVLWRWSVDLFEAMDQWKPGSD